MRNPFKKYGHFVQSTDKIDWDLIRLKHLGSIVSKVEINSKDGVVKLLRSKDSYILDSIINNKAL